MQNADEYEQPSCSTTSSVLMEERVQVDRKTLETMISDPFVKIIGNEEGVRLARAMICANFKSNKDRITLKMEINHSEHSFIIGRGGKNTRQIMQETACHIHFPDCNKQEESTRNDQVSIAGSMAQVERARAKLRLTSPIVMLLCIPRGCIRTSIDISSMLQNPVQLTSRLEISYMSIHLSYNPLTNSLEILFKTCSQHESNVVEAIAKMCNLLGVLPNETACHLNLNIRPELLQLEHGLLCQNTISWIALRTNTQIHLTQQQGCAATFLSIVGSPRGLLMSRKFMIGILPVVVQFKQTGSENDFKTFCVKSMESELEIRINEKCKIISSQQNTMEKIYMIRTFEANLHRAYIACNRILELYVNESLLPNEYSCINNQNLINQQVTKSYCRQFIERPFILTPNNETTEPIFVNDTPELALNKLSCAAPNSPDPTESPIAASLLASAKNINTEKGDFWKAPGVERQFGLNRNKMLLKASKAIYTANPDTQDNGERQPTDFWSGYGFSNSLPAELLKIGLSKNIWAVDDQHIDEPNHSNLKELSFNPKQGPKGSKNRLTEGRPIVGRSFSDYERNKSPSERESSFSSSSVNAPLASVKEEEDELNESNNLKSLPKKQTAFLYDPEMGGHFMTNASQKKPSFAASTSFFEPSSNFPGDIVWDIRVFHDPSIVLTQVGCKEYLPQFREQEIDMQALLLLDEANLKDIGVSTIGARKKLFNAILRLRESAKKCGHNLYK